MSNGVGLNPHLVCMHACGGKKIKAFNFLQVDLSK